MTISFLTQIYFCKQNKIYEMCLLFFFFQGQILARSKTRRTRKLFSEIFKSEFSILAMGQNRKLGNKKTRNTISEISEISEVSEFLICHFFIFQKTFSFQYSTVGNSVLSIYVMFCFKAFESVFFFTKNICSKYYLAIMRYICCEIYLRS